MKSHTTAALQRPLDRGFTLLELLVVMVIIAILASLTLGVFRYAQESAARNRSVMAHAAIKAALEKYKEQFGEYPEPANPGEDDQFTGTSYSVGGAHMLYQAITGDGNSAIRLPASAGQASESDGKVAIEEQENRINSSTLPRSCIFPPNAPAGQTRARYLVDGWNRPFQYTKANPDPAQNLAVNNTYDLWSFGPLKGSAQPTDSPVAKRDPNVSASWITNW